MEDAGLVGGHGLSVSEVDALGEAPAAGGTQAREMPQAHKGR